MAGTGVAQDSVVTVFGGSGFVGRHVVRALAMRGYRIRVASRRPDLAIHVQPSGRVGQVNVVQANLRYPDSVAAALQGASAVVNLVGILVESGQQNFEAVHAFGAQTVVQAAREAGISNVVQVSAIGADPDSPSTYARSKGRAEAVVRDEAPDAVILRPSIVFGPEDDFFNRFAGLACVSPVLPLIGGGHTLFQPVYVADVAEAVAAAVSGEARRGQTYELGGPTVRSFADIMRFICEATGRRRLLATMPVGLARIGAGISETASALTLGVVPPKVMSLTRDQVVLLGHDNVVSAAATAAGLDLAGLGIVPRAFENVVPSYLYRFRKTGQYDRGRIVS